MVGTRVFLKPRFFFPYSRRDTLLLPRDFKASRVRYSWCGSYSFAATRILLEPFASMILAPSLA